MRLRGTVREFKGTHGYIRWFDHGENEKSTFVHFRDVLTERAPHEGYADGYRALWPGDLVEFEVQDDGPGRRHAVRVVVIQAAAGDGRAA